MVLNGSQIIARALKRMGVDDFLALLKAFNDAGIHFAGMK